MYQLNQNNSSHLRILKSAWDNTLFQQSFERITKMYCAVCDNHN